MILKDPTELCVLAVSFGFFGLGGSGGGVLSEEAFSELFVDLVDPSRVVRGLICPSKALSSPLDPPSSCCALLAGVATLLFA